MTKEIIDAHRKFAKAEDKVPNSDSHKDFERLNRNAQRLWNKFEALCNQHGLKPLTVAMQLD